jgi:hydrogenase-1 operon protein HyaF
MTSLPGMIRPPVGFGPGSQSDAGEEGLAYLPLPSGMRTYEAHIPIITDPARAEAGRTVLERVYEALADWKEDAEIRIPVEHRDAPVLALIDEALGEGEVAVLVERNGSRMEIQEAALAGVWRVRAFDAGVAAPREAVLVSAFPRVALNRAFPAPSAAAMPVAFPVGLMNGLPILTELLDRSAVWKRGDPVHAVNFSLLPHTPEDLAFIEERLGLGATTILSLWQLPGIIDRDRQCLVGALLQLGRYADLEHGRNLRCAGRRLRRAGRHCRQRRTAEGDT